MYYVSAAGGAPLRLSFLNGRNAYVAGSLVYMTTGETDIVNERGEFLGRVTTWRGAMAAHAAVLLAGNLAAGVGLKILHDSRYDWSWDWGQYAEGTAAAADLAVLYHPLARISMAAAITNLGPRIVYRPSGEVEDLPRMARLGLCWTAVQSRNLRLRVMPELSKVLVGMFFDTTGTKTFGRMLREELRDAWKAVGVEATAFNVVSLRLGYFEDLTSQRGGLVFERESSTYHYGIGDVLAGRDLGKLKSIGLCCGFGIGYKDYVRFDVSSDAAIYDFPTTNWKFTLVSNDLAGLVQKLRGR